MDAVDVTTRHEPGARRYLALIDDEEVGVADYVDRGDRRIFTHTVIQPAHEGRGIGSELVRAAVVDSVAAGRAVVGQCPFVARWIDAHPEALDR
jgi:uncharacterized protein